MTILFPPCNNKKCKLLFRDFTASHVLMISVDSISVLWRTQGDLPGRYPLNPALQLTAEIVPLSIPQEAPCPGFFKFSLHNHT
jgi:hypothetical protein